MKRVQHFDYIQAATALAIAFAFSTSAGAIPIDGAFGTVAAGVITFANGSNTVHFIDWCPTNPGTPTNGVTCPANAALGIGDFLASGGTGTFASIPSNPPGPPVPGAIRDLVDTGSFANFTTAQPGVPVSINNFLSITTFPQFNFRAELLVLQSCAPSATTVCVGPFILTQVEDNVSVSMTLHGTVIDTTGVLTPALFTYILTGQFDSTTVGAVHTAMQSTGGIFSNTWSGSLKTVPAFPSRFRYDFFATGTNTVAASFIVRSLLRDVSPASLPIPGFTGFTSPSPASLNPCDLTSNSSAELDCRGTAPHGGIFQFIFNGGAFPTQVGSFVGSGFQSPDQAFPGIGTAGLQNGQISVVP